MEDIACNSCGQRRERRLFKSHDRRCNIAGDYWLVKCSNCGLAYVNLRPNQEEIKAFYPTYYYARFGDREFTSDYLRLMERSFQATLNLFAGYKPGGRVLEIGCGDGQFLRYLSANGYEIYGLDFSEHAVRRTRKNTGSGNIFLGTLEEAKYKDGYFDVVCLFEVLEHLSDPLGELREIRRVLKEEGVVAGTVPNFNSLERILLGNCWYGIDFPRHLYHFTKKSINNILSKAGFKILAIQAPNTYEIRDALKDVGYTDGIRVRLRDYGLYPSAGVSAAPSGQPSVGQRNILKVYLHKFEEMVYSPLIWLADRFDCGGTITFVARK
jgi:2-polyprenyl-3-methyl-5-hydroxy-6-metoxy-1,4-benzoquinol methylase